MATDSVAVNVMPIRKFTLVKKDFINISGYEIFEGAHLATFLAALGFGFASKGNSQARSFSMRYFPITSSTTTLAPASNRLCRITMFCNKMTSNLNTSCEKEGGFLMPAFM
ncbi:MAG: hypothetical protein IKZ24_01670 [Burkholderiaceae bacterium]|nr:hypothetical protein [Burkholderiaceae bacterium]